MNGLTECISGNVKAPIRDVCNLANSLHSLIQHQFLKSTDFVRLGFFCLWIYSTDVKI